MAIVNAEELAARAEPALQVALQHALGVELVDRTNVGAGLRFPVTNLAVTPAGTLHAAALAAIIETAGFLAVLPTLGKQEHAVTNMISTQYLRPAPAGEWVHVVGTLSRRARTLAFVSVLAYVREPDAATLIAQSQVTKSIITL